MGEEGTQESASANLCHTIDWKPDIQLLSDKEIWRICEAAVPNAEESHDFYTQVDFLLTACIRRTLRTLSGRFEAKSNGDTAWMPHTQKYFEWMRYRMEMLDAGKSPYALPKWRARLDDETYIQQLTDKLAATGKQGLFYSKYFCVCGIHAVSPFDLASKRTAPSAQRPSDTGREGGSLPGCRSQADSSANGTAASQMRQISLSDSSWMSGFQSMVWQRFAEALSCVPSSRPSTAAASPATSVDRKHSTCSCHSIRARRSSHYNTVEGTIPLKLTPVRRLDGIDGGTGRPLALTDSRRGEEPDGGRRESLIQVLRGGLAADSARRFQRLRRLRRCARAVRRRHHLQPGSRPGGDLNHLSAAPRPSPASAAPSRCPAAERPSTWTPSREGKVVLLPPEKTADIINIPMAHVWGAADAASRSGQGPPEELCAEETRSVFVHDGGHRGGRICCPEG